MPPGSVASRAGSGLPRALSSATMSTAMSTDTAEQTSIRQLGPAGGAAAGELPKLEQERREIYVCDLEPGVD